MGSTVKLFWFDRPGGNFGDDLNPWLWPKLLPGFLDADPAAWFVGIGTLLNERLPATGRLVVLGAGAGLGRVPVPDRRWEVHGVRGPLTAAALGLAPALALGDPAMLVARFVARPEGARGIGLMPHYASLAHWDWAATARAAGLIYVDPCAPVDRTLAIIAGLDSLLTEAMHGAIVADALRVPWVGVSIDPAFHAFKWRDWGASLAVEPRIHPLPALSNAAPSPRDAAKRALIAAGLGRALTPPPPLRSSSRVVDDAMARLVALAADAPRQLSADADFARATARFDQAIAALAVTA